MSTSRVRRVLAALAFAGVFAALANCGFGNECLRYSDCAPGLTCAAGNCVIPGGGDPTTAASTASDANAPATNDSSAPTSSGDASATSDAFLDDAGDAGVDADVDAGT